MADKSSLEEQRRLAQEKLQQQQADKLRTELQWQALIEQEEIKAGLKRAISEACHKEAEPYVKDWREKVLPSLMSGGAESYVEWITAMMKIAGAMETLFHILHERLGNRFPPAVIWDTVKEVACEFLPDGLTQSVKGLSMQVGLKLSPPKLKNVDYSVAIDDKGHLASELYMDAMAVPNNPQNGLNRQEAFTTLVESFLDSHGYHKEPDEDAKGYIYKNKEGEILTSEKFDKLNVEEGKKLNNFLHDKLKIDIQDRDENASISTGISP